MLNLLMTGSSGFWNTSPAFLDRSRCLTEYILPELKTEYGSFSAENIQKILELPCVFAYEKAQHEDARIGKLNKIVAQATNIRIDYTLYDQKIPFEEFIKLSSLLDISTWEWNRTHWTIKNTSIEDLRPHFTTQQKHLPTVFVSYSWSPPSNQQRVFRLIDQLEYDGFKVIYDKKDLLPGQDMNFFMESSLSSEKINAVIIVCNSDYARKANERQGGVGYESELILNEIRNNPLQSKYIPVVLEQNTDGSLPIPNFLKSRYCIDLTSETGYKNLIRAITLANHT